VPVPEVMPTLGRGRHRNPRRGACFMEMASYLAGERWSDHPRCTHSLLAAMARLVNDNTPDADRQELAPMIPSVIGLDSDDPRWHVVIARRAAATAIPIASESRQRALAVGLLTCSRLLARLDGAATPSPTDDEVDAIASAALAQAPAAWRWARDYSAKPGRVTMAAFQRYAAPSIVLTAVAGIAESCARDRPSRLRELLADTIAECTGLLAAEAASAAPAAVDAPAVPVG
jgi:hypothetical protein